MKKVVALFFVIAASAIVVAACAKSSQETSSSASSAAAQAASPAATTAGNTAMTTSALPIPLAKLPSEKVAAGDVAAGAKVFAANCESCHGAGGKNGTVGPSLAGTGLKAGQVAYMVDHPQAVDKQSSMPDLHLAQKEVADVAAYVASLK